MSEQTVRSRLTKIKADTLCDLIVEVGEKCDAFLAHTVVNVPCKAAELDELWGFISCKQKTAERKHLVSSDAGDTWTWCAIDADSKLILSHAVGHRDEPTCLRFLRRLDNATLGRIQITSDGLNLYTNNVPFELGSRVDFAQLIKSYSSTQEETRYSPAVISGIEIKTRFGNPDDDRISTSYAERFNLSVRMHVRRFTRLTNAFSKTYRHHAAMTAMFVAFYNFCRRHESLNKMTPAMASGLTDHVWTIKELLQAAK